MNDNAGGIVCQADGRVSRIDALTAVSGRPEHIPVYIIRINGDIALLGLRHNGYRSRGSMNAAAGLRLRDTLDTMHAGFIFQLRICSAPVDHKGDFLKSPDPGFIKGGKLCLPSVPHRIIAVHSVEISRKQSGFVAADARTDLHIDIFIIVRIFGKQQDLKLFFRRLDLLLRSGELRFQHFPHLGIILMLQQLQGIGLV